MHHLQFSLAVFAWLGVRCISPMLLTNIDVPQIVDYRDRVTLLCSYDMGNHKLNSVKWYKNDLEFFRYSPMMTSQIFLTFPVEGVKLVKDRHFCNEVTCSIELHQLRPKSSGAYRCEVSGDAPEFKLISRTSNMTVAALPQHDPIISGITPHYRFDEFVVANCTSDWSSPAASLSWYINDEKAPLDLLQPQHETTMNMDGFSLRSRSLEIRFHIDRARFINIRGILNMKCVADIKEFPHFIREKSVRSVILSKDELSNQKLVNWRSRGHRNSPIYCCSSLPFHPLFISVWILLVSSGVDFTMLSYTQR